MKKQQEPKCDPCEQRFEDNVHQIVDQVEGYTRKEHHERETEVEQAFADKLPKRNTHNH